MHDSIGIDIKGHIDLRHTAWGRGNTDQIKSSQSLIVRSQLTLSLEHMDTDRCLIVRGGGEDLALFCGYGGVALNEFGDKVPDSEKNTIRDKVAETRKAIESNDLPVIRNAIGELSKVSHKLAEEMYKKTAAQGEAQSSPEGHSGASAEEPSASGGTSQEQETEEKVVDAEFEEKKNS